MMLTKILASLKIPVPIKEHVFHPTRKWAFDYAWPDHMIALEVEGGVWNQGRHNRGKGFLNDMEKYNAAGMLGWRVFRTTPQDLIKTKTIEMIKTLTAWQPHQ
jgi:hypothetical protein